MGKYKEKVKAVVDSIGENSKQWSHFVNNKETDLRYLSAKVICLLILRQIRTWLLNIMHTMTRMHALAKVDLSDREKLKMVNQEHIH